ncbi:MAG: hypothetical protein LR011_10025 [Verrucomicrobia bacterium]|nr:hypothetical protein [Verrucomicrobiota bacterium]
MTLVDSLPYLINYPYGCIEQTMSRFMPAVVVKKTLMDLGFREADIVDAIAGGMAPGFIKSGRIKPGDGVGHLDAVIKASLERIYDFQKPGGGWGWWKEGQEDVYMSAYVVWGLAQAKSSGVEIDMASLERGRQYLQSILGRLYQDKDMLVWVMRALALSREVAFPSTGISDVERSALDEAWKSHLDFNAYTRSMLAVVAASCGEMEKARQLVLNLENGVIEVDGLSVLNRGVGDRGPRQVRWGKERMGMRWTDSAVESTSMAIEAMIRIHPQSELLEPAVNWLIANRRAANWNNTKDTAIAVLALSQYIRSAGEIFHPLDVSVRVNGQNIGELKFRQDSALKGLIALEVPAALLEGEDIRIELIRSESEAPLYYNIEARYFSHEKPIQPSGNSLFITRDLNILESYPTLLKGYAERARFLGDYPKAASGDRVRVRIRIEAKADLEYVMIEDFKPACLEYESVQSGYGMSLKSVRMDHRGDWVSHGGSVAGVYHEWRDNRGVFFMDRLPEGIYELEYDARVQVPGTFSGLPGIGRAMYVPEIQGNSLEQSWSVIGSE